MTDATELARKLLSAVYRTGQSFGLGHVTKVLTGADDERVRQRGHDRLSVFGIVEPGEAQLLAPVARSLSAHGHLEATEHGGLRLAGEAAAILKGERKVEIVRRATTGAGRSRKGARLPDADPLFEALRTLRRDLAKESQLPPYVIFHDATLREMAARRPANLRELGKVPGIGAKKLAAYGEAFLAVIGEG